MWCFLSILCLTNYLGSCHIADSDSISPGKGLSVCISNELPVDVTIDGLKTPHEVARCYRKTSLQEESLCISINVRKTF